MGVWIELRCDRHRPGCLSNINDGPQLHLSLHAFANVRARTRLAAERAGWSFGQGDETDEVVCPECLKEEKGSGQ